MSSRDQFATDDHRWAAVVGRNPAAQDAFVYCVLTTKIFCRPTCKVRLARRANVIFRNGPKEAQAAGFRACKRCRPELAVYVEPEIQTISKVCRMLRNLPPDTPSPRLDDLAAQAGLTKFHFHRLFKKVTGVTPRAFISAYRSTGDTTSSPDLDFDNTEPDFPDEFPEFLTPDLPSVCSLSTTPTDTLSNIWSPPPLSHSSTSTPWSEPSSEASCLTRPIVTYSFEETTFGLLVVAFNEAGNVCSLELGESREELIQSLEKKLPPTQFITVELTDDIAKPDISSLLEAIERPSGKLLNLDESVLF